MLDKLTPTIAPPPTVPRAQTAVPRRLKKYLSLDDFEPAARRILPKFLYGYISGGAETDAALRDNRKAFAEYGFVPRVLNDVSGRDQTATLFGKTYASPFGIPPMGSSALCAYRGDIVLTPCGGRDECADDPQRLLADPARGRARGQSGKAGTRPISPACPRGSSRWSIAWRRPASTPSSSPPTYRCRPTARTTSATASRCRSRSRRGCSGTRSRIRDWLFGTWSRTVINHGMPHFENMDATRGPPVLAKNLMRNIGHRDQLAWKHVELIRKRWKGKLVVKGLVSPHDARIARESGVDGVMRLQPWRPPARLHGVARCARCRRSRREASGMTVMLDGGIRRGTDVIKALALGAHFVFDRPALPLCGGRRRPAGRGARDLAAARRDRPRPRAARHPQPRLRSRRTWCRKL